MIPFGRSCSFLSVALVAACAVLLGCAPVHAEELISTYTSTKPQLCRKTHRVIIDGDEYASTRVCPGKAGYTVIVDDDDLRTTVTIGKKGKAKAVIAGGSEGRFSSVHDAVEWRSVEGAAEPFAIIIRWSFRDPDDESKEGKDLPLLIVARLSPGPICQIAFVDTTAEQDANALARQIADEKARDFKCNTDTAQLVGARGRASNVFMP
jgi:hypothetical protein